MYGASTCARAERIALSGVLGALPILPSGKDGHFTGATVASDRWSCIVCPPCEVIDRVRVVQTACQRGRMLEIACQRCRSLPGHRPTVARMASRRHSLLRAWQPILTQCCEDGKLPSLTGPLLQAWQAVCTHCCQAWQAVRTLLQGWQAVLPLARQHARQRAVWAAAHAGDGAAHVRAPGRASCASDARAYACRYRTHPQSRRLWRQPEQTWRQVRPRPRVSRPGNCSTPCDAHSQQQASGAMQLHTWHNALTTR